MYVKIERDKVVKFPYALTDLIVDNPYVSFPSNISDEIAADFGVFPVESDKEPVYDSATQFLKAGKLYDESGRWKHEWEIVDISEETLALRAAIQSDNDRRMAKALLSETDWVELPSVVSGNGLSLLNKSDFDLFRAQLRAIVVTKNPELVMPNKPDPEWSA